MMLNILITGFLIFGLIFLAIGTFFGWLIFINCRKMLLLFNVHDQEMRAGLSTVITIFCLLLLAINEGSGIILGMIAGVAVSVRQLSTARNSDGSIRLYSTVKMICWLVIGAILGALSAWAFILLTTSVFWN